MLIEIPARELTLEAAQNAGSTRSLTSRSAARDMAVSQIKKLLDSRNDREKLEGLRKVISVTSHDPSYFSAIPDLELTDDVPIKAMLTVLFVDRQECSKSEH